MIPTEVLLGFIAVLTSVVSGWSYAHRLKAEGDKKKLESQLKQVEAEAEIKINAAKADLEERAFIRQQLLGQLKINEQHQQERERYEKRLAEKDAKAESNYRVSNDIQRDLGLQIVNLINAIGTMKGVLIERIDLLPGRITTSNVETLTGFAKSMAAETGAVIAQQFAIQSLDRDLFPFPDPEDPGWKEEWIIPITPEPTLHKQPYFNDAVKLHKPCAQIAAGGERVRVIRNRIKGWVTIYKSEGETHCWGWLPEHTIKVGKLPLLNNA